MKLSTHDMLKNVKSSTRIEITGELLVKVQNSLLGILKDFVLVCEKYGFYYSLCGGSALGAIRNQGFIPWDDDIDVFMLRNDYNEFLKIFKKELGEKYYLHSLETTPEYGMPVTQLMKKGTIKRSFEIPPNVPCGLNIDIWILDNAPDNRMCRSLHGLISTILGLIVSCSRFYKTKDYLLAYFKEADNIVKKNIKKKAFIGKCISFCSLSTWSLLYTRWNSIYKNNNSRYVVCATGTKHYFKEIFLRSEYCTTVPVKFEDTLLMVIKDADKALTRLYGDYMKIPPIEKRETHFVSELKL